MHVCLWCSLGVVSAYIFARKLKMYENWKEIEDNENIKKEFADYFYGLMRHEQTGLVLPPKGAASVPLYQVYILCKPIEN